MPTALVTGAGRGIGAAVARRLAQDGFDLRLHCHESRAGADAVARDVAALGRRASVHPADLGDPAQVRCLGEEAQGVAAVVHNAGLYDRRSFEEMTGEAWRKTAGVDLEAPALLTRAALPSVQEARGAIVFISSITAARGSGHGAHYAAAKAGLLGLTRSLAMELAPVRVNAVCPGYIDTAMLEGDSPQKRKAREQEVPLGRIGRPEEVAGAVSFLLGPDASYITGQELHVNGGLWP